MNTLADNKRIDLLQEVAFKYMVQHEKMKGEAIAVVTTAVPLSTALEKQVLAKVKELTDSKVSLENKIDENIVGGFILRIGDLQYDASVANKLNRLKREFTNSL
ncbi:MAG: ATP synthase F1 subunit delta [Bacteroidota bacterium]